MSLLPLQGKTVLLVGACGVLGQAHARAIVEAGANLIIADLPSQGLIDLSRDLKSPFVELDCRCEESIAAAVTCAYKEYGEFDGAIYNVAVTSEYLSKLSSSPFPSFEDYPVDLWNETLAVNLTGAFLFAREVCKYLRSASSSLVIVSSIYGVVSPDHSMYVNESFNTFPGYAASKAGIIGFVRWLSTLWAKRNTRVNSLSPGGVFNQHSDSFNAKYSARTPMNRMAMPSDMTGAMIFLLSDASVYMTGQNLIIDGGLTAW